MTTPDVIGVPCPIITTRRDTTYKAYAYVEDYLGHTYMEYGECV